MYDSIRLIIKITTNSNISTMRTNEKQKKIELIKYKTRLANEFNISSLH